jgi:glycine hydroxymethyltransferase
MIAAKAVIFKLARDPGFVRIQKRTLANAKHLASEIQKRGYGIVTGGTENHQVLVDVSTKGLSGKEAEEALEAAGMVTNRNIIPKDMETPGRESGIRLGTGAVSARGMEAREMAQIAGLMDQSLMNRQRKGVLAKVKEGVSSLCGRFPVPKTL